MSNFNGFNPRNSTFRGLDTSICPKDSSGKLTGEVLSVNTCHDLHKSWHAASYLKDVTTGGTGQYDKEQFMRHSNAMLPVDKGGLIEFAANKINTTLCPKGPDGKFTGAVLPAKVCEFITPAEKK